MTWLQGLELEEPDRRSLGFTAAKAEPREIVEALSWFMSLAGPTVLAFDQLDPICVQADLRGRDENDVEATAATAILREIGDGLAAIRQRLVRTFPVVVSLEQTYAILRSRALSTSLDRFEEPRTLGAIPSSGVARALVAARATSAFAASGFSPPYATWPFREAAFETLRDLSPREALQRCEAHRRRCLAQGEVVELPSFAEEKTPRPVPAPLDAANLDEMFERERAACDPATLLEEGEDERLAPLLQAGLRCLVAEADLPPGVDALVDVDFTGGTKTKPLHARLRLVFHDEQGREEHFSVRALQRAHHLAYLSRMKGTVTAAGIDRRLAFRRLTILRTRPIPNGPACAALTEDFRERGGAIVGIETDELRTLWALAEMQRRDEPRLQAWLRRDRAASRLSILRAIAPHPLLRTEGEPTPEKPGPMSPKPEPPKPKPPAPETPKPEPSGAERGQSEPPKHELPKPEPSVSEALKPAISRLGAPAPATHSPAILSPESPQPIGPQVVAFGRRVVGERLGDAVSIPVAELSKHVLVLAGAGSGKTVFLKRLIEETALLGIPSIVVDVSNDLSTLGEPPEPGDVPSEAGLPDDARSARFRRDVEVVVWTPGRPSGRALSLEPLPDLTALAGDEEELEEAVAMVREALRPIVAPGASEKSKIKEGTLTQALRYLAKSDRCDLDELVALLRDLPAEAGLGLVNESKLAQQMADAIVVERTNNPLLRTDGAALDPAVLFGDDVSGAGRASLRSRISVLNLVGLVGLEAQQAFVNQLAMTLFAWIKRHPRPIGRELRGLLVIDEAKDFAAGRTKSLSRESLVRLVAQSRKYGLGVVLATQNPKDLDHRLVANCSTHVYGKVNSPAAIDTVQEQMKAKGGSGSDVARLPRGVFYIHNADVGMTAPVKVRVPMCLSRHSSRPPSPEEILARAAGDGSRRT